MRNLVFRRNLLSLVIILLTVTLTPTVLQAQTSDNHPPLITSSAPTTVTAGQTYQYKIEAADRDNDPIQYRFSANPEGMSLTENIISWQPIKVGTFNVVVEASDNKNGYNSQSWQITVSPAAANIIVVAPNDKPTVINLGNHQQFAATVYDQYMNEVSDLNLVWSVTASIGSIDKHGLFVAEKGGQGSISATIGETTASIGVVVKDIRPALITKENTNTATTTAANQENSIIKKTTPTATPTATTEENTNEEIIAEANTNSNTNSEEKKEEKPCTNMPHWLIILLLILYPIILYIYYRYEKRHRAAGGWWLFPFFLTVVGLIIYYKYMCAGTYLWWPWLLVGLGIVATYWYKGKRRTDDFDSQEKLPF